MIYVQRNKSGHIVAIHKHPIEDSDEVKSLLDPEVIDFFYKIDDAESYRKLLSLSDVGIIRVIEDLVEVLVKKNIIRFTDLPEEAQQKIIDRKDARNSLDETSSIMISEENII